MRKLRFRPMRRTLSLLLVAAALTGLTVFWLVHERPPPEQTPSERALEQIRQHLGPEAELRFVENAADGVVCGFAGRSDEISNVPVWMPDEIFISTPERVVFRGTPEFYELERRYCSNFYLAIPPIAD